MAVTRGSSGCRRRRTPARTSFQKKSPLRDSPKPYRSAVHHLAPVIVGAILGVATAAVYLIGANRSYGYDEAAMFANFVATPSLWDEFALNAVLPNVPIKGVASNDHVLLSFLSHVIYSTSGSRSEAVYRLVPVLAAGGTVGLTTAVLIRRFGIVAGICAGLFSPLIPFSSTTAATSAATASRRLAACWRPSSWRPDGPAG